MLTLTIILALTSTLILALNCYNAFPMASSKLHSSQRVVHVVDSRDKVKRTESSVRLVLTACVIYSRLGGDGSGTAGRRRNQSSDFIDHRAMRRRIAGWTENCRRERRVLARAGELIFDRSARAGDAV